MADETSQPPPDVRHHWVDEVLFVSARVGPKLDSLADRVVRLLDRHGESAERRAVQPAPGWALVEWDFSRAPASRARMDRLLSGFELPLLLENPDEARAGRD